MLLRIQGCSYGCCTVIVVVAGVVDARLLLLLQLTL